MCPGHEIEARNSMLKPSQKSGITVQMIGTNDAPIPASSSTSIAPCSSESRPQRRWTSVPIVAAINDANAKYAAGACRSSRMYLGRIGQESADPNQNTNTPPKNWRAPFSFGNEWTDRAAGTG